MSTIKSSAENLTLNADGANNDIKFQSNGVEKASIDQDGNLVLSGTLTSVGVDDNCTATKLTVSDSGININGDITFSSASQGICLGVTSNVDANTLDDYEEGTWTPTAGVGLTVVGGFSSSGSYTKIGRKVFVEGYVAGGTSVAVPSANAITISSLPFSINFSRAQGIAGNGGITASAGIQAPNTNIYFNEAVSATTYIRFAINYTTTA